MNAITNQFIPNELEKMFEATEKYSMKKFNESAEYVAGESFLQWCEDMNLTEDEFEPDERIGKLEDDSTFIMLMYNKTQRLKKWNDMLIKEEE